MKNIIRNISFLIVGVPLVLALYTNVAPQAPVLLSPEQILQSSRSMSLHMASTQFSDSAKIIFQRKKIQILNYFASKVDVQSCAELLTHDPTMLTGVYNLYPGGHLRSFLCEVEGGRLVRSTDLNLTPDYSIACEQDNTCLSQETFNKRFVCNSPGGSSKTYCAVDGVFGTPLLVSAENTLCTDGNFGYDSTGFWVKSGCRGTFAMSRVLSLDLPLRMLKWNKVSDSHQYRIDIKHTVDGVPIVKENCIKISKASHEYLYTIVHGAAPLHEYVFNGVCDDKSSVELKDTTSARLCFTPSSNWSAPLCTPYLSLKAQSVNYFVPTASEMGTVVGAMDPSWVVGNQLVVRGWACHIGDTRSIRVHVYSGNQYGKGGLMIGEGVASLASEAAVSSRCMSTGTTHRYEVKFTLGNNPKMVANSPLYVYGISAISGKPNSMLANSGAHRIPQIAADYGKILGYLDAVVVTPTGIFARGWACQAGDARSVTVRVYAGGGVGTGGRLVATAVAQNAHEPAVEALCRGRGTGYRFSIPVPSASVRYGEVIHVIGNALAPPAVNRYLNESGKVIYTPTISWNAGAVNYYTRLDIQSKNSAGVMETTTGCLNGVRGRTAVDFNGQCINGKIINPANINLVRVCAAINAQLTGAVCSPYVALADTTPVVIPGIPTVVERRNGSDR